MNTAWNLIASFPGLMLIGAAVIFTFFGDFNITALAETLASATGK